METDDPFDSIVKLCHVSSSQESRLSHCRFALELHGTESDDGGTQISGEEDFPVASTGIVMVSPMLTSEEERGNDEITSTDVFQTPPEEVSPSVDHGESLTADRARDGDEETVVVDVSCTDSDTAVDGGRETDLGFSEVEMTQKSDGEFRIANGVIEEKVRVHKRESASNEGLIEYPSRKLKILGEDVSKAFQISMSKSVSPYKYESPSAVVSKSRENSAVKSETERNSPYDSAPQRKLYFSAHIVGSKIDEGLKLKGNVENGICNDEENREAEGFLPNNDERNSASESTEFIDKFMYGDVSFAKFHETEKKPQRSPGKLELLLDVLKVLKRDGDYDPSLRNLSILEVAKRCGMKFHSPRHHSPWEKQ